MTDDLSLNSIKPVSRRAIIDKIYKVGEKELQDITKQEIIILDNDPSIIEIAIIIE